MEWKEITGFKGLYECSTSGRFRSIRTCRGTRSGKELHPYLSRNGYLQVALRKDGRYHRKYAHRLIAETFIGPSNLPVNHKNGLKSDNRVSNLEFLTCKENLRHAINTLGVRRGENHWNARLTTADIAEIYRLRATGMKQNDIAKRFGIKRASVAGILTKRQWAHFTA